MVCDALEGMKWASTAEEYRDGQKSKNVLVYLARSHFSLVSLQTGIPLAHFYESIYLWIYKCSSSSALSDDTNIESIS